MRYATSIFSALLFFSFSVHAQLTKIWDKRYGGSSNDEIKTIITASNGNIIIGGNSSSGQNGDKTQSSYGSDDYWIVCADSNGNTLWDATFGGSNNEDLSAVIETSDGGFLIGGSSYSGISGTKTQSSQGSWDFWIVKTDASGNYEWDKRFGGTSSDYCYSICNTQDGGYLLAGSSESNANGDKSQSCWGDADFWAVKINSTGTKLWDKRFGGTDDDYCYTVYQNSEYGYLLAGSSYSGLNGDKSESSRGGGDYWAVRIDSTGTKIWDKRFGTSSTDYGLSAAPDGSDGVVIGGHTSGGISGDKTQSNWGSGDYWLVHVNSNGAKVWDAHFGGTENDDSFGNVYRTSDGGYISTGTAYSDISGNKTQVNLGVEQSWTVKCDANGIFVADRTLLDNGHEELGIATTSSGGCIIMGNKSSAGIGGDKTQLSQGGYDYFIAKFCVPGLPVANYAATDSTLCQNQCITFTDASINFPSAWAWTFPGGTPSSSSSSTPTICYNTTGTYDVNLIVSNISGSDTIVHPAGIVVSVSVPVSTILQNGPLLTCTPAAAAYQWYFNYVSIPGATGETYVATLTGLYSVMTSNEYGCSATSPAFNFNMNVTISNFTVSDTLICQGSCVDFIDLSSNNPFSWNWLFPGASIISSTQQNPAVICYTTPGIFPVTLTVHNQYGQSTTTLVDYIHVIPIPSVPSIIQNGDTLFCVTTSTNFQWYFNGTPISGATDQSYIPVENGTYAVSITNDECQAISPLYTFYLSVITAFSVNDSSFCSGTCLDFYDQSLNNPTAWYWTFPGASPPVSTLQNPVGICYATPGIYQVTLTSSSSFSQSTLTQDNFITVSALPATPVISQFYDTLFCNSMAAQYQWFQNGNAVPGATGPYYQMPVSGNYGVTVTNNDGCSASANYDAEIPLPGFAALDSVICEKFCTGFYDASTNNPVLWKWLFEGGTPSSSVQQNPANICYDVPGLYDVTLITYDGYKYDTLYLENFMTVFPTPPLPVISNLGDTLFSTPAAAYQWLLNSVEIPGATSQTYLVVESGVYTIITFSKDGCSAQVSIYFDITSIKTLENKNVFEIFPNPGSGIFKIIVPNSKALTSVSVFDLLGSTVSGMITPATHAAGEWEIDLQSQSDGFYFVQVCFSNGCEVKKIIKHSSE